MSKRKTLFILDVFPYTDRQIIINFHVLQPQTVCENLDCLQVWFERIELIWSPDSSSDKKYICFLSSIAH